MTIGLTRAAELIRTLEKLTARHADTLSAPSPNCAPLATWNRAEAEVYAARTCADQRVAATKARLAEKIDRRRDAEAERDHAHADREQANDAVAHAITRMDELTRELTILRDTTDARLRAETARAQQADATAVQRADRAQAQAAEEVARIWADAQRERDELHAATDVRIGAFKEARTALRIRADPRAAGGHDRRQRQAGSGVPSPEPQCFPGGRTPLAG